MNVLLFNLIFRETTMASTAEVLTRKPANIAVHTTPDHKLELVEDDKIPEPGEDECLVHVRATGICGSGELPYQIIQTT